MNVVARQINLQLPSATDVASTTLDRQRSRVDWVGLDGGSNQTNARRSRRLWRCALWWLIRRADGENAHFGRGIPNRRQTFGVSALALTARASSLVSNGYSYIMGESADACACESHL